MAITVNENTATAERIAAGVTSGNEVIFKTDVTGKYSLQAVPTAAGTASLKTQVETLNPSDFSTMAEDTSGSQSASFQRIIEGSTFVGVDVISGTWNVTLRRI